VGDQGWRWGGELGGETRGGLGEFCGVGWQCGGIWERSVVDQWD
jgi:hypothetical protein